MADNLTYYERRADFELQMARRAKDPAAVLAHYTLADLYLERVYASNPSLAHEIGGLERALERSGATSGIVAAPS